MCHAHLHAEKESAARENAAFVVVHDEVIRGMPRSFDDAQRRRAEWQQRISQGGRTPPYDPAICAKPRAPAQRLLARRVHENRNTAGGGSPRIPRAILVPGGN